jgi:hypothetical protein
MVVKRVAPLSVAKVAGIIYALLGLCFGLLFSLFGLLASAFAFNKADAPFAGVIFGAGAIVFLPILYGVVGFVFSLIGAALYNVVAGWVGGVEVDLQ